MFDPMSFFDMTFANNLTALNANYISMNGPIQKPVWTTPYKVIWTDGKTELLEFCAGPDPIVISAPEACHGSMLVDWSETQSQVRCAMDNYSGGVYAINKLPATQEHKYLKLEYTFTSLWKALEQLPGKINLVGDCQAGTTSAIVADRYPWKIKSLTIVGSPMETSAARSNLDPFLEEYSQADYEDAVKKCGGNMNGWLMVTGFLADKPFTWRTDETKRWANADNAEFREADRVFRNWYYSPQDIPGPQYLQNIQKVFRDDLCDHYSVTGYQGPVTLVAGTKDPIVPIAQMFAMQKYWPHAKLIEIDAGHIGIFMSKKAIANEWTAIFKELGI